MTTIRSGDLGHRSGGFGQDRDQAKRQPDRYKVIYERTVPSKEGQYAAFPDSVTREVSDLLMAGDTHRPYTHQALAASYALDQKKNVGLVTHTASGKTVAFLAPTLTVLQTDASATALMVYPMNALAVDQLKNLQDLGFQADEQRNGLFRLSIGGREIIAGVLNGETPEGTRRVIRESANLVLTNHVALHAILLAQAVHEYADGSSWRRFLMGLRIVTLDEGHSYNGVEGTNAALAFRRLFLCTEHLSGRPPQVIMATATIGNADEHARNLTGLDNWAMVDKSGAKVHARLFQVVLPQEHPSGEDRWAASSIALDLAKAEIQQGRRELIFCSSRPGTEKMADRLNAHLPAPVALPFHAGIPPEKKTEFINRILSGKAQAVCTTSALELGVDIGGMDTSILLGHPGDNASFGQRAGRVGRTGDGKVILVLDENQHPINTYLQGSPEAIFAEPESRTLFPRNRIIATRHAACALIETNGNADLVRKWFPTVPHDAALEETAKRPHASIAMIGLGNFAQFSAKDPSGGTLQVLGGQDALTNWHKGAAIRSPIGEFFRVVELDLKGLRAITEPAGLAKGTRVYTTPRIETYKNLIEAEEVPPQIPLAQVSGVVAGIYDVRRQAVAFKEFTYTGRSGAQEVAIELPPEMRNPAIGFMTYGIEMTLQGGHPLHRAVFGVQGAGAAMKDALGMVIPLLVQARPNDVPIEITSDPASLTLFIYDLAEGGMGWSVALARRIDRWMALAGSALLKCPCALSGCPRCSLSSITGLQRRSLALTMRDLRS
jgi:DEAD/DEAH box helicase domain-containing protein